MSEICLCVGMIASGKSTYCKQKGKEGWVVINDDAIVNMLHGGTYTLYNKTWKPLYKAIEDNILHIAIAMNKSVIIDRGVDISIKSRTRWIAIAHSLETPIKAIVFERFTPEIHARRRFESDDRGHDYEYWLNTAKAHSLRYENPTIEEGFCEIEFIQ